MVEGGVSKSVGRPRLEHNITAIQQCNLTLNQLAHKDLPSTSEQQLYYNCPCALGTRHIVYRSVRSANKSKTTLKCRVCKGQGSKWEKVLYKLLDEMDEIEVYAVEACSLDKPEEAVKHNGVEVHPAKKRWDATLVLPGKLLIEMQGQGHIDRLVTKSNNTDSSLDERHWKDCLYAETAKHQGWSVLWMCVDETITSLDAQVAKWAAGLKEALEHVRAKGEPELFVA